MTRCTFEVVASGLHDSKRLADLAGPTLQLLQQLGAAQGVAKPATPHLIVVASGGTEAAVLEICKRTQTNAPGCPALLVAHPKHNSLPAALESLARLHQLGHRGRVIFLEESDDVAAVAEAIDDLTCWHQLHTARIGLVGPPSDWLVSSTPTAQCVASRWGPELVDVSIPETIGEFNEVTVEIGRRVADRFGGIASTTLPAPDGVVRAARLDPALRAMIDRHDLDAITVRCFDFLGSLETSGCVALAQLNDDGIVAGCEGDVPSALALLWVRLLLDQPGWIANPASIRTKTNELVLAHCTIAPSMVDELELSTHFESGIGVGVHGQLRHGDVTIIRVGGIDLDRQWIANGHIVATGHEPDLCRTQATVKIDDRNVSELLNEPLGNHVVLIEGAHRERLERWWDWALAGASAKKTDWRSV